MGNEWDYQQRKMEIAWEIALRRLNSLQRSWDLSERHYEDAVRGALTQAWEWVNEAFPPPPSS